MNRTMVPRECLRSISFLFAFVLLLLLGSGATAQTFGPSVASERILILLDREGNVRGSLASYYTRWENPFKVPVTTFSDLLDRRVSREFRVVADTPASPLFEGKYVLSRRWSIGFWYNPIRGERLQKTVQVAEKFVPLNLERNTDLVDLHLIYTGPDGLSVQLGFYRERGTIHDRNPDPLPRRDYTLHSWNLWLTQRLDVYARGRLINPRLDVHVIPFVSAGYHASADLNRAVSVLTGIAVTIGERISLSGSLWLFDLSNTATRITGGLVIQY